MRASVAAIVRKCVRPSSDIATLSVPERWYSIALARVFADARHEPVVAAERRDDEVEMRSVFFDLVIGREHAGRRLRRTHARRAVVGDHHGGAAASELVADRAADDAAAKNDDVARSRHGQILAAGGRQPVPAARPMALVSRSAVA